MERSRYVIVERTDVARWRSTTQKETVLPLSLDTALPPILTVQRPDETREQWQERHIEAVEAMLQLVPEIPPALP